MSMRGATRRIRSRARRSRSARSIRTGRAIRTTGLFLQDQFDRDPRRRRPRPGRAARRPFHPRGRPNRCRGQPSATRAQSLGVVDSEQSYQDWTFSASLTWAVNRVRERARAGRPRLPRAESQRPRRARPERSRLRSAGLVGDRRRRLDRRERRRRRAVHRPRRRRARVRAADELRAGRRAQLGPALRARPGLRRRAAGSRSSAARWSSRPTRVPASLAGLPVTPIPQTAAQAQQGVVSVATGFDPRAVKAFVNEGSARYYGVDATRALPARDALVARRQLLLPRRPRSESDASRPAAAAAAGCARPPLSARRRAVVGRGDRARQRRTGPS